ncbi:MAG: hypothetical protein WCR46_16680 [Deltaproteobacteria bacterium]|jgi:hypothetical protein
MASPRYVLPFEPSLIVSVQNCEIAVVVSDPMHIVPAAKTVKTSNNLLDCVILRYPSTLDTLDWSENWIDIPLVVEAQAFGQFRLLNRYLEILRRLDVRIHLPLLSEQNASGLRILSSLGIDSCAVLLSETDWNVAADLMTYAVLGRCQHAPIQPFNYIAENYNVSTYSGWGEVIFDDPKHYLHMDELGRVALTVSKLTLDNFLHVNIRTLANVVRLDSYCRSLFDWRQHFLLNDDCAKCPGWRCCRGGVAGIVGDKSGCSSLFTEMLDVAELYRNQRYLQDARRKKKRWSQS